MKIILTESGYSTDSWTEIQQAKFELRDWALLYDSVDKLYWYNTVEKDHQSPYEHYLGHIRMNESTELYQVGLPSEAKPVFLAMSNRNALLANSELVEKNITDDGSIYDYVFKTTDNNRIHMIWGTSEAAVSHEFNIETGKIVKYDMYGNSEILNGVDIKDVNMQNMSVGKRNDRTIIRRILYFVHNGGGYKNKIGVELCFL